MFAFMCLKKLNSVAFSPRANHTDRAAAAGRCLHCVICVLRELLNGTTPQPLHAVSTKTLYSCINV